MGDRDIVLVGNGMHENIMKRHEQITPAQNVYYSVEVLFPEAVFVAASVPKMYIFSSAFYGAKGKRTDMDDQLPPIPYSNYIRDKANLDVLCAGIWQALGEAIDDEELEKLIQLMQRADESFIYYATHYIDKCNIELLKTVVEKRKDKLRNIAKRIVKKPQAYMNMEAELRYWEKEYKTTIYELRDVGVKTCQLNLRVYNVLYLCISAPLYEARCSKNSDIGFLYVRHRSRHTSLYALLLNRHPCRFWLVCEQSSKNI